jgi:hypothetical protein
MASLAVSASTALISAGVGVFKLVEAKEDFYYNFGDEIVKVASSSSVVHYRTSAMMQDILEDSFRGQGAAMIEVLVAIRHPPRHRHLLMITLSSLLQLIP